MKDEWMNEWMPKLTSDEVPINPYRVIWDVHHTVDLENTIATHDAGSPRDIRAAIELISSGRINVREMITHRLPLERTAEGFGLVAQAGRSIKVVIEPQR